MKDSNEKIKNVDIEISHYEKELERLKKRIPLVLVGGIILSLISPYLSGRGGHVPIMKYIKYSYAVAITAILFTIIYSISYYVGKDKIHKRLRELKLKKYLIEKEREV